MNYPTTLNGKWWLLAVATVATLAIAQSLPIFKLSPDFQPLPLPPPPQVAPGFHTVAPPGGPPPTFAPLARPPTPNVILAPATEAQVHTIDDLVRIAVSTPPVNIKLDQSPVFARWQFIGCLLGSQTFRVSRLWRDERGALVLLTEHDYQTADNVLGGESKTMLWRAPSTAGLWRVTWASKTRSYELAIAEPQLADNEIDARGRMVLSYANSIGE